MSERQIYTDGGCHGNPGPGGWAYVVSDDGRAVEGSGNEQQTTNNRMELSAVINALRFVQDQPGGKEVVIHTDSQYVKNGITVWIHNWIRNGWRTASKQPVKNQDLWIALHELDSALSPRWEWVRGHSGDPGNERCDQLVQAAIARIEDS